MKQVGLPIDYFSKTARREYANWRMALPREFFQNSFDAGCNVFRIDVTRTDLDTIMSVQDNGRGMSLTECEEKLLTMGGSGKDEYSIGGFGVAKGLLFFAWKKWSIRSRNFRIEGEGCQYEAFETDDYVHGFHATIHIDNDDDYTVDYVTMYLERCYTSVDIYVNGVKFNVRKPAGKRVKTLEWATLHKVKTRNGSAVSSSRMAVRIRGVHMFEVYVDPGLDCLLTLELHGNTRDLLTSNRDSLKAPYNQQLNMLVNDITVNVLSSVEDRDEICLQKFAGNGLAKVDIEDAIDIQPIQTTMNELMEVANIFDNVVSILQMEPPVKSAVINEVTTNPTEESRLHDFPDILVKTIGQKLPAKFNPKTWPVKVKTLMKLWMLVLKQVMLDSRQIMKDHGLACRFGIGVTMDHEHFAEFTHYEEIPYFLLNPEKLRTAKRSKKDKPLLPKLSGKNALLVIRELRQHAIHEIAHFVTGKDHNERFVAKMHEIESKTWGSELAYKGLLKLVTRKNRKKTLDNN